MKTGFIFLLRSILESYMFQHPGIFKVWIWLLVKARWKDGYASWPTGKGDTVVTLKRGDVLIGRNKAAEELGMPGSTFYSHLKKLQSVGSIKIKSTPNHSIISIVNFDKYQNADNLTKKDEVSNDTQSPAKKVGYNHPYKDSINRKSLEQRQQELKEGIYSYSRNIDKKVLDEAYADLSQPISNNLNIQAENIKDFNLEVYLRRKAIDHKNDLIKQKQ